MIKVKLDGVWAGELNKKDGCETKQTMPFILRSLSCYDIQKMAQLSDAIYAGLKPEEACYIHRHDLSYYEEALKQADVHYIGVFVGKELVAMSSLTLCRDRKTFNQEIPGCQYDVFHKGSYVVAALGGDCVLPAFRGNKLNQIMIDFRVERARKEGCTHAFSIVDRHNHWNMTPYFSNGFTMFSSAIDPSDNGQIALMQRPLRTNVWYGKSKLTASCCDFDRIDVLLNNGYVGHAYDSQTNQISFVRMSEATSRLNDDMTVVCPKAIKIASFEQGRYTSVPHFRYFARV